MKYIYFFIVTSILLVCFPLNSAFAQSESRAQTSSWLMIFGIGYGSKAGADFSLTAGYKFGPYFGLYGDLAFKTGGAKKELEDVSPVFATDIAIVPKFQAAGKCCLFSLGLGLGYYYYLESNVDDYYLYTHHMIKTHAFLIKPEMALDFVFENGFILGLGIDVPVYIGTEYDLVECEYHMHLPDGTNVTKSRTFDDASGEYVKGARFDFQFHFGYKF